MKNLLTAMCCLGSLCLFSQKAISESYTSKGINKIFIDAQYADCEITSYDGKEILVEAIVNINGNEQNEAFILDAKPNQSSFNIVTKVKTENLSSRVTMVDYENNITVIKDVEGNWEDWIEDDKDYKSINVGFVIDIKLKISVPNDMDLQVKSVYGDAIVEGNYSNINALVTYGDIDLTQERIPEVTSIDIKSVYGHVDYTIPANTDLRFELSSSYGEIFTDLDVKQQKTGKSSKYTCYGSGGTYILGNGGSLATLVATYDNIYIRADK